MASTTAQFIPAQRRAAVAIAVMVLMIGMINTPRGFGQSGHILDGVGPVDQGMGGATTALPLDAIGSIHRNPASIIGLPSSEIGIGMGIFAPTTDLRSSVPGFGAGSTGSDVDIAPLPSLGIVQKSEDGNWAFGFGGFAVAGFGYTAAVSVPGVGFVWSLLGSSMAILIAFIVPTTCYLKIREHKRMNPRSVSAWILLLISIVVAPVCTQQAIMNS